jgi:hypothetical protein
MSRKTRAQKIQSGQRQRQVVIESPTQNIGYADQANAATRTPVQSYSQDTILSSHTTKDLVHIVLTASVCFILLAIATVFLSDFSWAQAVRQALHLPTLSL